MTLVLAKFPVVPLQLFPWLVSTRPDLAAVCSVAWPHDIYRGSASASSSPPCPFLASHVYCNLEAEAGYENRTVPSLRPCDAAHRGRHKGSLTLDLAPDSLEYMSSC